MASEAIMHPFVIRMNPNRFRIFPFAHFPSGNIFQDITVTEEDAGIGTEPWTSQASSYHIHLGHSQNPSSLLP